MQNREFLYFIRKYRFYSLAATIVFVIGIVYYTGFYQAKGYAEAKFMMNGGQFFSLEGQGAARWGSVTTDKGEILSQVTFICSDEMLTFLAKRFDLFKYYSIPEESENAYLILRKKIFAGMKLNYLENGVITLSYTDKSGRMAADIVNAILENLETINKSFILQKLYRQIALCDKLIIEGDKEAEMRKGSLLDVIDELKEIQYGRKGPVSDESLMNIQLGIYKSTYDLVSVSRDLENTKKTFSLTTQLLNDNSDPLIKILNKAYPEVHRNVLQLLFTIVLSFVIVASVLIFLQYYYTLFSEELKIIFGR